MTSPTGSAAASNSSRRVSSGSDASRWAKPCSIRLMSDIVPGSPNPPATVTGVSPRGSSSSARGLPPASARMRARTDSSSAPGERRVQQRVRVGGVQARDRELGQAAERLLVRGLAEREHERDALGQQAARDEGERLCRDPVEPLRVVDDAQQRALLGRVGEQREHRQPDQEAVGRRAHGQPERRAQGVALGRREPPQMPEQRRAQPVQAGERELHLGLDAGRPRDPEVVRGGREMAEERGLADTGLTAQHEHPALATANVCDQPVEFLALDGAAE